jgi:hypothetical protein
LDELSRSSSSDQNALLADYDTAVTINVAWSIQRLNAIFRSEDIRFAPLSIALVSWSGGSMLGTSELFKTMSDNFDT